MVGELRFLSTPPVTSLVLEVFQRTLSAESSRNIGREQNRQSKIRIHALNLNDAHLFSDLGSTLRFFGPNQFIPLSKLGAHK